ncbi:MAG TPA: hypothetical protein VG148_01465 [Pyrinomonadaceae bacterium]|nr:hypothetical protein [Pyrinomonadaceae bacterium]
MKTTKARRKKPAPKHRYAVKPLFPFNPRHTALPDEEVQWLVARIVARGGVEPFVRRMVALIDDLRAGRGGSLTRVAAHRRSPELKKLLAAMSVAVREGRVMAAYHTAFYSAHCAYQSSLDYLCELLSYLDRFRKKTARLE